MASDSEKRRVFVDAVRLCLRQKVRVELSDGRTVEGTLDCYDNSGNMILACTTDVTRGQPSSRSRHPTYRMGTVLVPGHVQVSIKVLRPAVPGSNTDNGASLMKMQHLGNALDQDEANINPADINACEQK